MSTAEETPEGFYPGEDGEWVPNGWSMDKISSVFPYVVDNRGKTPPIDRDGGFELIEVNAISKHSRKPVYSAVIKFLSEETFRNWFRKGTLQTGDILMPTVGTIGEASICLDNRGAIAQNLVGLRCCERNIPMYWYYWFCSPHSKKLILNLDIGGVQPSVKVPHLLEQKVKFPAKSEQKAIAAVLGSLDDKIELLREQNETLEALAQTLFKHWFIDFNFPDENGNPYKDSGGKMIPSELGQIPEGWTVTKLKDFGAIVCGKTPSKTKAEYFGVDVPFIKIPDMHGNTFINVCSEYLSHAGADSQRKKTVPANSILVSCIATVGLVSMTIRDSQTNQQINAIVPNRKIATEYLYLRIKTLYDFLQNLGAGGSATLNINTSSFSEVEVVSPSQCQLEKFHSLTGKLFTKIKINSEQIQTLTQLRDTLLPKLMKGEVRIKKEEF